MKLRPYQQAAVDAIIAKAQAGEKSCLLVLPTGCGKTVCFASLISRIGEFAPGKRALVIAHREELIYQAADKIMRITGDRPDIEMAGLRADIGMFNRSKTVVASKDTLRSKKRLSKFNPDEFGLVITDEAHHAVAASYKSVYSHFDGVFHVGVTATPDRTDEEALGQVFGSVAMDYELPDAIGDGWLCPIHQRSVEVHGLDYSAVRTTAGDLNGRDLAEVMSNEEVLQQIADATIGLANGKKTLVFAPPGFKTEGENSFRASERLTEIFNRHKPGCARLVMGETPNDQRQHILTEYREGVFQFLVNVGVFTEGFDDPSIEVIAMARATKSRSLYAQIVGRGTRPLPGIVDGVESPEGRRAAIATSAKPTCTVLDFEGNAGQHKLIHVADILGGNYTDKEIELAETKVKAANGTASVTEMLEAARKELRRKEEFERMRRASIIGKARYEVKDIDAFDVLDIDRPVIRGWDRVEMASDAQKTTLGKFGIKANGLTKKEASALLGKCIQNARSGMASYKQQKLLAKFGYDTGVSFTEASKIIDAVQKNGWKRPVGVPA